MSENDFVKKMLEYQKNIDLDDDSYESRQDILKAGEKMLNHYLSQVSPEEGRVMQDAYNEFLKAEEEVLGEKGEKITLENLRERIPNNLFLKTFFVNEDGDLEKKGVVDFDKAWDVIQKEEDKKNKDRD